MVKTVALIAAAGQGSRMGSKINKQYLSLLDKPVLAHTLQVFEEHPAIHGIIIIAAATEVEFCRQEIVKAYQLSKVMKIVAGGKERQDSIYRGIEELPDSCQLVVVHDGARPLITPDIISQSIETAQRAGAAIVAVPVKDTIKTVEKGVVQATLDRSQLWSVQTPQVFKKDILQKAYQDAFGRGFYGTDDASLVELLGVDIQVVPGSYENIKITTPEDIVLGSAFLRGRGSCG